VTVLGGYVEVPSWFSDRDRRWPAEEGWHLDCETRDQLRQTNPELQL